MKNIINTPDLMEKSITTLLFLTTAIFFLFESRKFFRLAQKARLIPSSKVRSAAQGYVELQGKAYSTNDRVLFSPLTKTPCCWYSYDISKASFDENGNPTWHSIRGGNSNENLFVVRDNSAECLIFPYLITSSILSIKTIHNKTWQGNILENYSIEQLDEIKISTKRSTQDYIENPLLRLSDFFQSQLYKVQERASGLMRTMLDALINKVERSQSPFPEQRKKYLFTENIIKVEDPLYLMGKFRTYNASTNPIALKYKDQIRSYSETINKNKKLGLSVNKSAINDMQKEFDAIYSRIDICQKYIDSREEHSTINYLLEAESKYIISLKDEKETTQIFYIKGMAFFIISIVLLGISGVLIDKFFL